MHIYLPCEKESAETSFLSEKRLGLSPFPAQKRIIFFFLFDRRKD